MRPRLSLITAALALAVPFTAPPAHGADPRPAAAASEVLAEFDVANDGDWLLMPVTISGREYRFVLGTGATCTCFDTSIPLGAAQSRQTVETTDGTATLDLFAPPAGSVGRLPLRTAPLVPAADFGMVRKASGHEIRGMLGMDFLRRYVIRLDVAGGKVTLLSSAGAEPGRAVKLSSQRGRPCVEAAVPGVGLPEKFVIDTGIVGLTSGDMPAETLARLRETGRAAKVGGGLGESLSGTVSYTDWRLPAVSVGGFSHRGLVFSEAPANRLHLRYLSRYVVTFDFPRGVMYLREGKHFGRADLCDRSGLHLLRDGGRTVVHSVDPGSAGAAAGVKAKDVVVRVGARKADRCRMYELREMLCAAGQRVPVVVQRDGKEVETTLLLKE